MTTPAFAVCSRSASIFLLFVVYHEHEKINRTYMDTWRYGTNSLVFKFYIHRFELSKKNSRSDQFPSFFPWTPDCRHVTTTSRRWTRAQGLDKIHSSWTVLPCNCSKQLKCILDVRSRGSLTTSCKYVLSMEDYFWKTPVFSSLAGKLNMWPFNQQRFIYCFFAARLGVELTLRSLSLSLEQTTHLE